MGSGIPNLLGVIREVFITTAKMDGSSDASIITHPWSITRKPNMTRLLKMTRLSRHAHCRIAYANHPPNLCRNMDR